MELENLRQEIDKIDEKLTKLFTERMQVSGQVAAYKKERGLNVLNRGREREILARVSELAGDDLAAYARIMFATLFELSRSYQELLIEHHSPLEEKIRKALDETSKIFPAKAIVACQGVEGSYSQQACDRVFSFANIMYFKNFAGVFNAVEKGLCQYGVLPIENSSHGSVNEVYDLMRNSNFHIAHSIKLHISHCLLGKKGVKLEDVKEIVSHEQAIGQCSNFLATLPNVKVTVCENTATAAKIISESDRNDIATLSSRDCAAIYGLSIIKERVHNTDNNYTRFIVISKNLEIYPGADKISIMFDVNNTPGALSRILARLSSLGLNMTKLESRPLPGTDFRYMFYMDFEASVYSDEVIDLLCEMSSTIERFAFLGSYKEV